MAAAAAAMAAYLPTLYPGVGGGGDAAKFQYLGRVLGTAHAPGYPLYIFVSWAFSHLPFGNLAYRINFMSAAMAACAVACVVLALRTLGCRRWAAFCAGLALAFDRYLWGKAVGAEVYSLGAALIGLMAVLAARWASTRRDRDLYALVLVFGISLGNHLTAAMVAPAIAIMVLVIAPSAIRVRTVAMCALLVVAGLSQYLFILIRTLQQAPFVEAHASNLRELFGVLRATPYADEIFAFSVAQLVGVRLPVIGRMFLDDFGPMGLACLAAGLAALAIRRQAAGIFAVLGAAGVVFLSLNVDADVEGFLVPAFVLSWVVAGIGMDALSRRLARWSRPAPVLAAALMLAIPSAQLAAHYKINDHHRRTVEIRYLNALFARLEERAAIVREAYSVDQLILYKLAGEQAAGTRTIFLIPAEPAALQRYVDDGYAVYAFSAARGALESRGFGFEPIALYETGPDGRPGAEIDMADQPLFRVTRRAQCLALANQGWRDITAIPSDTRLMVRIDNYRPFDSEALLYLGGRLPESPPLLVLTQGPVRPDFEVQTFRPGLPAEAVALTAAAARDGVPEVERLRRTAVVHRVQLRVNDDGQFSLSAIELQERPDIAFMKASADLQNPLRATACGWSGRDLLRGRASDELAVGIDGDGFFGEGWKAPNRDNNGPFRGSIGHRAELALPLAQAGALRLTFRMRLDGPAPAGGLLFGVLNGHEFSLGALNEQWTDLTADVDGSWVRRSLNQLELHSLPSEGRGVGPSFATQSVTVRLVGALSVR